MDYNTELMDCDIISRTCTHASNSTNSTCKVGGEAYIVQQGTLPQSSWILVNTVNVTGLIYCVGGSH